VHPRGYTRAQVEELDAEQPDDLSPGERELLELLVPLAPLGGSAEVAHNIVSSRGHSLRALRAALPERGRLDLEDLLGP
jgi:hypothetical protein